MPVNSVKIHFLVDTFQICLWLTGSVHGVKGAAKYLPFPGSSRFAACLLEQLRTVSSVTLTMVVRHNWLCVVSKCIDTAGIITYLLFPAVA